MRLHHAPLALVASLVVAACSSAAPSSPTADGGGQGPSDAGALDGAAIADARPTDGSDGAVDKSKTCVGTFGSAIGSVGFARFDGTVVAVLAPANKTCTAPNSTHLVLELKLAGAVYRMVVDVNDAASPGTIHAKTLSHAMVGGPWSDGWHAVALDYGGTFGLHAADFTSESTADAVAAITDALDIGAHVSVFATAMGEVDSAHLIHKNVSKEDGAIVVDVEGSPRWLLLAFSDQSF